MVLLTYFSIKIGQILHVEKNGVHCDSFLVGRISLMDWIVVEILCGENNI